jgi:predicted amidophosphoribosyltransferase
MISEGPSLIEPLSPPLQEALRGALAADETLIVSVRGGSGAALAATDRRLMTLSEPGILESGAPVRVRGDAWEEVRELSLEERPVGGRLRWLADGERVTFEVPSYDIGKYRRVLARLQGLVPAAPQARGAGETMDEKPCPKCGSGLPAGAAFCPVCGLQVLDVCWECGEPLRGDWAYCPRCGTNASETGVLPCPACREPVGRGHRYCAKCGAEARALCGQCGESMRREWRFCPECGTEAGEEGETRGRGDAETRGQEEPALPQTPRPRAAASAAGEAAALNDRGVAAYERDRFEEAIRLFRQAIAADPSDPSFYVNLAVALEEDEQTEEAIATYRQALELDPNSASTYLNLGYLFSEHERMAEAREAWEQVIRIDPRSAEAKEARDNLQHLDEL